MGGEGVRIESARSSTQFRAGGPHGEGSAFPNSNKYSWRCVRIFRMSKMCGPDPSPEIRKEIADLCWGGSIAPIGVLGSNPRKMAGATSPMGGYIDRAHLAEKYRTPKMFDGTAPLSPNPGSFEIRVCPCAALVYLTCFSLNIWPIRGRVAQALVHPQCAPGENIHRGGRSCAW